MSRASILAGFGLALALGACADTRLAMTEASLGDSCGATERQVFIGERVEVLNDADLPENTQVLFPGAVTDPTPQPERLTFTISTEETITEVYCG